MLLYTRGLGRATLWHAELVYSGMCSIMGRAYLLPFCSGRAELWHAELVNSGSFSIMAREHGRIIYLPCWHLQLFHEVSVLEHVNCVTFRGSLIALGLQV